MSYTLILGLCLAAALLIGILANFRKEAATNRTDTDTPPSAPSPAANAKTVTWSPSTFGSSSNISHLPDTSFKACKKACIDDPTCKGISTSYMPGFGPGMCVLNSGYTETEPVAKQDYYTFLLNRSSGSSSTPTPTA